jgi:hypothetical protein
MEMMRTLIADPSQGALFIARDGDAAVGRRPRLEVVGLNGARSAGDPSSTRRQGKGSPTP